MESASGVSEVHEVIVNASLFYERALGIGYEVAHERSKVGGKHFGKNLCKGTNKAYAAEINDFLSPILLG